jgi:hypothetical protein
MQVGDLVGHTTRKGLGVVLDFQGETGNEMALVHFANNRCAKWYDKLVLEPYATGARI